MANGTQTIAKISGYLEKKAKLRIGSPWKKYWFVLEGRLLLYYRSKDEYKALSPCKGSINLCPPCNIKPALSAAGVFQIECRGNTVTLRAESRSEQERWMQALLAATTQSKSSPSRMSHFRYSLDDLPVSVTESKNTEQPLSRQNTMPYRLSSSPSNRDSKQIISRLQQMGAQTYGGSLGTITKLAANRDHSDAVISTEQQKEDTKPQQSNKKIHFPDNEQYSIIQEENSMDTSLVVNQQYSAKIKNAEEKISERVPSIIIENDQYIRGDNETTTKNLKKLRKQKSLIVENEQYDSSDLRRPSEYEESYVRRKEIQRIEHLYERISSESNASEPNDATTLNTRQVVSNLYERISVNSSNSDNLQIEINDQYSVVKKSSKESLKSHEYTLPINSKSEEVDHGKNSFIIDNDQYIPVLDDKRVTDNFEYAMIDHMKEMEQLYEDPDQLRGDRNIEPALPPRHDSKKQESYEETSSQSSCGDGKRKKIRNKFKLLTHLIKSDKKSGSDDGKHSKLKDRSTSFIRRVWKRKTKSLGNDVDVTYETVDYDLITKQIDKGKNDIEMLQELQKILETRKNMLQEKLRVEKKLESGGTKVKPTVVEEKNEKSENRADEELKEKRPTLPPRQNSQSSVSLQQQEAKQIITETIPTITNPKENIQDQFPKTQVKTIDEILEDLDKEKSKQKVKQLIEKFEDIQNDDEVVLRKKISKSQSDTIVLQRLSKESLNEKLNNESDELSKLLEELSKVTSAPVLTPGVTSSLVTPTLTDDEWLQLIPIRRRRLSDPDYDVPRPHRSLQLQDRPKQVPDNAIPATRFFGPILPPSPANDNMIITDLSSWTSIDPDSLEIDSLQATPVVSKKTPLSFAPLSIEKDRSISYTLHNFIKGDKIIYAHPKTIISPTKFYETKEETNEMDFDFAKQQKINNNEMKAKQAEINENFTTLITTKTEEIFVDSLEPLGEISTAF